VTNLNGVRGRWPQTVSINSSARAVLPTDDTRPLPEPSPPSQRLLRRGLDVDRASDAAKSSLENGADKPITAAGAAALLEYITTGPITGLFELGDLSGGSCACVVRVLASL